MKPLDDAPEALAVIHLDEMRHFMRDDVIDHRVRREDQPPGERKISVARAAAPAADRVAHGHTLHLALDQYGHFLGAGGEFAFGKAAQEIARPPRQESAIAGDADLAIFDPGRPFPANR